MAHRDDTRRVLATCRACKSVYAAREWPDGTVKLIGRGPCACGSTAFDVIEEADIPADADESDRRSNVGSG